MNAFQKLRILIFVTVVIIGLCLGCKEDPIAVMPTVTTDNVALISASGVFADGAIVNNGGAAITKQGFVWGTSSSPTIPSPNSTSESTGSTFISSNIEGLTSKTTYYLRAYASNSVGTAYGNEVVFKTLAKPAHFIVTSLTNIVTSYDRPAIVVIVKNDGETTGYNVSVDINALQGSVIIDKGTAFPADLGDILPGQSAQDDAVFFKLTPAQVSTLTFSTPVIDWLSKD